jgi:hypothetical protein
MATTYQVKAQLSRIDSLTLDTLRDAERRLIDMGLRMITTKDEDERMLSARNFLITVSRSLRINNSYFFPFDSIKSISKLYSPDGHFRIITWNIALNNGTYHYYGVIQLNPDFIRTIKDTNNLRSFYPLIDRSAQIKNALDTTLGPDYWYGAAYYQIHKNTHKKQTYYTLIGWNGANIMTNKKVVDVLYWQKNQPRFGAPVFQMNEARFKIPIKRLVYEFNNAATMTLRVSKKKKYLVVENIVPPKRQDYGKPETYLPDGSYEYFVWEKGFWIKKGPLNDFDIE